MFSSKIISTLLLSLALWPVAAEHRGASLRRQLGKKKKNGMMGMMGRGSDDVFQRESIMLKVTNLAFQQPFGGVFVMTHNAMADPLFTLGEESTEELALLAENGDPGPLVGLYDGAMGVGEAFAFAEGAPFGGRVGPNTFVIEIPYDPKYPYISLATMAINTNDCFVAINGRKIMPGDVFTGPGYDSGSEVNNELCNSIPGPACPMDSGNERSGMGEGFVHVHRGFFGLNEAEGGLTQFGYDWRNPMVRFEVM